jgi:SAM-dependent methyltransferase
VKTYRVADACICCGSHALASSPAVLMPFVAKRVFGHEPIEVTAAWGVRDLKPGTSYTPCHSLQCQDCGVLFLDYRFTGEQMDALYRDYRSDSYTRQRDHYEPGYAATLAQDYLHRHPYLSEVEAWLAPHLPEQPTVLDWGGGDGCNALFLGRGRVQVHDISGVATVAGVQSTRPGHAGDRDYDLVACSQVLEHVPEPLGLLREILPVLSPRTLLYVEVPREALLREHPGSLALAPRKRYWHEHINFFTEASLRQLLGHAGIQVIAIRQLSLDNGVRKGEVFGVLGRLAP